MTISEFIYNAIISKVISLWCKNINKKTESIDLKEEALILTGKKRKMENESAIAPKRTRRRYMYYYLYYLFVILIVHLFINCSSILKPLKTQQPGLITGLW